MQVVGPLLLVLSLALPMSTCSVHQPAPARRPVVIFADRAYTTAPLPDHIQFDYFVWPRNGLLGRENTVATLAFAAPLLVLALRSRWHRNWPMALLFWLQALPTAGASS